MCWRTRILNASARLPREYSCRVLEARSDVVGSLLRPPGLLDARERFERGELAPADFKRVEDAAVDDALRLQEEAGLDVVTDGEMRRLSFQSQMTEAVDGFGEWDLDAFLWGEWRSAEIGELKVERPPLAVEGRLRRILRDFSWCPARDWIGVGATLTGSRVLDLTPLPVGEARWLVRENSA